MGRDWQTEARRLHRGFGSWPKVARYAKANRRQFSPAYFWKIADGQATPNEEGQNCIDAGLAELRRREVKGFTSPRAKDTRKTVHIRPDDFAAGNLTRKRSGLTWPELLHEWRVCAEESRDA